MEITKYKKLVTSSLAKFLPNFELISFNTLTPDASARRYFRIELKHVNFSYKTVIAMLFLSNRSPEAGGQIKINSDQAVLELGKFLHLNGVTVPEIYFEDLEQGLIFIEDLGDLSLAEAFRLTKDLNLYKQAISQIKLIQEIKIDKNFFAFKRQFGFEQYRHELNEILDFYLDLKISERDEISKDFDLLAQDLDSMPKVLVHRDYHSWNLMVDSKRRLRVIDYQDALMATNYYDLVALLNDRDTDSILGHNAYLELLNFYYLTFDRPKNFILNFLLVALQRDLKVVGRFAKLDKHIVGANYSKWIPGTLRRIARSADFLGVRYPKLFEILKLKQASYFLSDKLIDLGKFNDESR